MCRWNVTQILAVIAAIFTATGCECAKTEFSGDDVLPGSSRTADGYLAMVAADKTASVTWDSTPDGYVHSGSVVFPQFPFDGPDDLVVTMVHGNESFAAVPISSIFADSCSWTSASTPITLKLRTANGRLDESISTNLWVRDNGQGFVKERVEQFNGSLGQYQVPLQPNQKQYATVQMDIALDGSIKNVDLSIFVETTLENDGTVDFITVLTQPE